MPPRRTSPRDRRSAIRLHPELAGVTLGWPCWASASSSPPSLLQRACASGCTTQERTPLVETATELQATQEGLKTRILELREQIQSAEQAGQGSAALVSELNDDLQEARIAAGLIPLNGNGHGPAARTASIGGPGLTTLDAWPRFTPGRPDDHRELWAAGAEAIAVNGERITPTTAVIDIGTSLLVNSAYLAPPYQVTALGPADLYDRLSRSAGFVEFIRARAEGFGIRLSFAEPESVDMPAFAGTVTLLPRRSPCRSTHAGLASTPAGRRLAMHRMRNQLTLAPVALAWAWSSCVQLQAQAKNGEAVALSSQGT